MSDTAAPAPAPRSIGERLRAGRERAGLSVAAAAEKLHLDNKVIEALEADRFAELGASVYVRGHLRRYADFVGEAGAGEVVPADLIVEFGVPVDLHRAGDVAGVVEQHVFVGFDHDQPGFAQVLRQPLGGDQPLGMRVLLEGRGGVGSYRHPLTLARGTAGTGSLTP